MDSPKGSHAWPPSKTSMMKQITVLVKIGRVVDTAYLDISKDLDTISHIHISRWHKTTSGWYSSVSIMQAQSHAAIQRTHDML